MLIQKIINLGEYQILINMKYCLNKDLFNNFQTTVLNRYQPILLDTNSNSMKKVHFTINLTWNPRPELRFINENKTYYYRLTNKGTSKSITTYYDISLFQFEGLLQNIYRLLITKKNAVIMHLSAIKIRDNAFVFLGVSGAGKSTIAKLLSTKYQIIADDNAIIDYKFPFYRIVNLFPFYKKNGDTTCKLLIKAFFFLYKKPYNHIDKINNYNHIYNKVIKQLWSINTNKQNTNKEMKFIMKLCRQYKGFYKLEFNKNKKEILDLFSSFSK